MSVLAAAIESDALSMRKEVYSQVNNTGAAITFAKVLEGRKKLVDSLAPAGVWNALLNTTDSVNLVDALKGLFQDSKEVATQYREGKMGRGAGFDFMESTHLSTQTRGAGNGTYLVMNGRLRRQAVTSIPHRHDQKGEGITFAGVIWSSETKATAECLRSSSHPDHAGLGGHLGFPARLAGRAERPALRPNNCRDHDRRTASVNSASPAVPPGPLALRRGPGVPGGVDFARRAVLEAARCGSCASMTSMRTVSRPASTSSTATRR